MSGARRILSLYARIGRVFWSWAPSLLLLAVVVFLPLGLLDAVATEVEVDRLDIDTGLEIAAVLAAVAAITATSLLGEVFFSGAVAVSLTSSDSERPSLAAVARRLDYRRLIAVDLLYVAIVLVGLLLFVVPGLLAFVWLGLAGPVVEIERRGVRDALRRSFRLVRGRFWTVALVLIPIELVGDSLGESAGHFVHGLLGDNFLGTWLAESAANFVFSPLFAVATVLLTLDLIAEKDGNGPSISAQPRRPREVTSA